MPERSIAITLFERNKNRLVPTPAAEAFYSEISRVDLGIEHLDRFVHGLKHDFIGQIDFGSMPLASYQWMPELIARFLRDNQVGSISMTVRSSRQILEWVAADRLDFGIIFNVWHYPQVKIDSLLHTPNGLSVSSRNRFARQNCYTYRRFAW